MSSSSWKAATLGDVCQFANGQASPRRFQHGRYPVFGSNGVIGRSDESNSPAGTTIVGRVGSFCGSVHFSAGPCWVTDNALRVIPSPGINQRFLYFLLRSLNLNSHSIGSGQPMLTQGILSRLSTVVPAEDEQRVIAEVLGALDDKIEANDRLTHISDELWRTEMKRLLNGWDVSEGSLPSGWSRVPLSSLARFVNGRNFTKDASGSGRVVVRIAELNSGPGGSTVYNDINVPSDHVTRPGDLLFAWSGSLTVQRWYRPEAIVNQHIFKVIPDPVIPMWLMHGYLLRLLPWYRQVAAGKATTMGHIQRHHLDEAVVLPNTSTLQELDARCAPLWDRALAGERESLVLAELRDTLLPSLLSGDLRIRDAKVLVGEGM